MQWGSMFSAKLYCSAAIVSRLPSGYWVSILPVSARSSWFRSFVLRGFGFLPLGFGWYPSPSWCIHLLVGTHPPSPGWCPCPLVWATSLSRLVSRKYR